MTENWSEADLKTWRPYLALFLSFVLAFGGFVPGTGMKADAAIPEFSTQNAFYVENSGSQPAFSEFSLDGDNIYSGGYMEFVLENPIPGESLSLQTVAEAVYTDGEVSIVGTSVTAAVYLGLGDGAKYIGDVLPVNTGTQTGYRIVFPDQGRLVDNGDMEDVYTEDFTKPVGWTVNTSGQVLLNDLASKTKGPSYGVTSTPLNDGSGKYRIEAADSSYSFISDFDYDATGSETCELLASGTCPQAGWAYEGDEIPVTGTTEFSADTSHSFAGGITFDSNALRLEFTGNIQSSGEGASIGSAFGPEAYSPVFEAKAGAALAFKWSAQGGQDQYEVYGFLVNEDGVTLDGSGNVTGAASAAHTELMYGRGAKQDFTTSFGRVPADGEYRFRFVAGSYDATDGQALGASLFIDDIKVYEDFPDEAVLGKIGALVQYQNTASHEEWEAALGDNLDRTIKVETQNINGESERTSADFTVQLEPQLVLESVTVQDAEPQFATLTFNLPVDPSLDAADFESFTVDGKAIVAVHSVDGENVQVELEAPVQPGAIDVRYDEGQGDISSASYDPNKLKSIGDDAPEYPDNGVTPLELERVEVVGEAPYNVADLIFNKPVTGPGVVVGEEIPNFTIGGKPVEVVSVSDDGKTVRVTIDGTFEPGDKVDYDSDNGIVDEGNTNNPLTSIDGEDDTVQPVLEVIEDPLKLIQVEVDNETPDQVKLTFNHPISDETFDWEGFEINGLIPVGKISPDDNDPVVVLQLPEPLAPGDLTLNYDKAEGPVGSYYNPIANQLDNIGSANQPETERNNIQELQLVRVTTDPEDPNQLKLKFNMPVATGGLTPAEAIAGLTVGEDKKSVYFVEANEAGDEIIVRLDAPYQAGDELAYDEAEGDITAVGNVNNKLGDINIETIPMVSGKVSDFGLELDGEPLGLQPGFDPDKNNGDGEGYLAVVPNEVTSVSISPTPYNTEETVTKVFLNGVEIVQDAAEGWDWSNLGELQEGPNEIQVQVFDKTDLTTPLEEYAITIIRATGKLISLVPSSGQLDPAFDADAAEQAYDIRVRNSVRDFTLTPTTLDPGAQIEMSINGEAAFAVENGVASENMRLREGTNTIVMTVTDSDGEVTEYTLTVIRSKDSSGGGAPIGESRTVDVVIGGDNESEIVKVDIIRTTQDGNIHDQVTFTPEKAEESAQKAAETGESIARMVIPDPNDEVSELQVDVPVEALAILQDSGIDLEIYTDHGVIRIPRSSLEGLEEDFYFRLVPVRDPEERSEVEERATTERIVREMAGNKEVYVVTRPMTIETNLSSRPVTLILPLRDVQLPSDAAEREQFLNELSIFIEHSDGDKELVQGKPVRMNDGSWGLQFGITKFSTFTIVHTASDGRHESYVNGYPDGTFKPQKGLTRAELAMILDNLGATGSVEGEGYSDVAESHWAADAIKRVQAAGLMTGYLDETFRPEQVITRAEMASFAFNYLKLEEADESRYPDVESSHWAYGFISALSQEGWMEGYLDGTFKPARELTRAEAVTLINQLFERGPLYDAPPTIWPDVSDSHWAFRDIMEASVDHAYKLRDEDGEQWVSP